MNTHKTYSVQEDAKNYISLHTVLSHLGPLFLKVDIDGSESDVSLFIQEVEFRDASECLLYRDRLSTAS